jgi:hypothetical protein
MFFLHFIGGVALTDLRCVTGRSLPPPHAGCPRGDPGSLPVLILPLIVSHPSKLNHYLIPDFLVSSCFSGLYFET